MEIGKPIREFEIPEKSPERIFVPNWPEKSPERIPERIPVPNWPVKKPAKVPQEVEK